LLKVPGFECRGNLIGDVEAEFLESPDRALRAIAVAQGRIGVVAQIGVDLVPISQSAPDQIAA
jgi:hypothetical protein